jgi:hypothetical protein
VLEGLFEEHPVAPVARALEILQRTGPSKLKRQPLPFAIALLRRQVRQRRAGRARCGIGDLIFD